MASLQLAFSDYVARVHRIIVGSATPGDHAPLLLGMSWNDSDPTDVGCAMMQAE